MGDTAWYDAVLVQTQGTAWGQVWHCSCAATTDLPIVFPAVSIRHHATPEELVLKPFHGNRQAIDRQWTASFTKRYSLVVALFFLERSSQAKQVVERSELVCPGYSCRPRSKTGDRGTQRPNKCIGATKKGQTNALAPRRLTKVDNTCRKHAPKPVVHASICPHVHACNRAQRVHHDGERHGVVCCAWAAG